ncbi:beta-ketoacyl-[acyl-carrier-protein] synthase family protein [Streptomyces sp. LX-29]|uniref:beta-ketoacyl-[acyl-carrier-protein] synthase family protein n=1 Tax=Streptomyces sp. LX-29 TaxID=2900152 RepID=UPI00240E71BC|nr:beta-ketoacyl-[acyl-carrier-protein] synthase family protein [Streptomyces sp. LX-29]WFB08813.1 beta-ketoacyl-[acyl-carrier-protein] synthase family protein [Streptomyces sp. LX-29]
MTEVVITGLGAVCHLGGGVESFYRALLDPERAAPDTTTDPLAHVPVPNFYFTPEGAVPAEPAVVDGLPVGHATRTALTVAREAVADAGLAGALDAHGTAVLMGSSVADAYVVEDWRAHGSFPEEDRWTPVFSTASVVAQLLGVNGLATGVSNACSGSGYSMAIGADMIRAGEADVVVAGGFETYSRVALAAFNQVGALDPVSCRPFDVGRGGTVLSEGAGAVVLERADRARARGARIYATLAGSGWSCDAFHATGLDPEGAQIVRAMRDALEEAEAKPDDVSFIVPHATGTKLNDVTESRAMEQVFGPRTAEIPLYSLKALTGHTGGASGGLGVVAAALFLHHGSMAPNLPVAEQDPECRVHVPTEPTPLSGRLGMVNAYAFGGNNMSLVLQGEPR